VIVVPLNGRYFSIGFVRKPSGTDSDRLTLSKISPFRFTVKSVNVPVPSVFPV